jgi:DNA-binding NtrC family response regulator
MKKILIFDAYPSIRELLAEELAADGNTVVPIGNPDLISDLIISFEPDLLIMDPYMRGKMRWEVFEAVKAQNPKLPILLFTEGSSPDPHFSQADVFLPKSYLLHRLKQKIKETLERRPSGKRGSEGLSVRKSKEAVL